MRKLIILMIMLLPLLSGCRDAGSLELNRDGPQDIERLLNENEFYRARQLAGRHPDTNTSEIYTRISGGESAYENAIAKEAYGYEAKGALYNAARILENALLKVPQSKILREHLNRIELNRLDRIRINERLQMIVRARYIIDKREYYLQQESLLPPEMRKHGELLHNDRESEKLAKRLREHGKYAFETNDLQTAKKCMELSRELKDSNETRKLLEMMKAAIDSQKIIDQLQVESGDDEKRIMGLITRTVDTKELLEQTTSALAENDLMAAQTLFSKIPAPDNASEPAIKLQKKLDQAVSAQVRHLVSRGDREYRADDVISAIQTWTGAQKLDPENPQLKERLERASRVLARLEQFKRLQGK